MSDGDLNAAEDLLPIVYDELHRIAARIMHSERKGHTLQPTALINEAFMKVGGVKENGWEGRSHFLRVAARAMRSVLIDHARAEAAQKRKGKRHAVTLHDQAEWSANDADQVLAVHEGLQALADIDEQLSNIVELRFFGGLSNKEIAEVLDTSLRTIERGWQFARSWLRQFFESTGEATQ
jgi:RNA polymerase sigma factor (TIGR02999 family)